ncbi:MAG: phosphogluconate dehydrogenase (NAD(+)-dependent, decarboxylating) [Gaiellaceae bacterium]
MQLGMIGLVRMGANLVRRLEGDGHECVVYDVSAEAVQALVDEGVAGVESLEGLVQRLTPPRAIWVMVPSAFVGDIVDELAELLDVGDAIIDGGNSYYRDDVDRASTLASRGIEYVDVGTSGGIYGLERGFCLMIGGNDETVARLEPIFRTLAPGVDAAERTPSRSGIDVASAEHGYLHCGGAGAGHFVKMIHNGVEYGLMAAFAEGLNILESAGIGLETHEKDAETAPLRDPEYYSYDFDIPAIAEVWRRGSVVASWLLDLTAEAFAKSPTLEEFSGRVSDSGEGRWTVLSAVEESVPAPVLTAALYERFSSRGESGFADQVLSAMRKEFGGHVEKAAGG